MVVPNHKSQLGLPLSKREEGEYAREMTFLASQCPMTLYALSIGELKLAHDSNFTSFVLYDVDHSDKGVDTDDDSCQNA